MNDQDRKVCIFFVDDEQILMTSITFPLAFGKGYVLMSSKRTHRMSSDDFAVASPDM